MRLELPKNNDWRDAGIDVIVDTHGYPHRIFIEATQASIDYFEQVVANLRCMLGNETPAD